MGESGATPTFQEDHVHRKLVIADLFSPPSESESQEKSTDTEMEEEMEAVSGKWVKLAAFKFIVQQHSGVCT